MVGDDEQWNITLGSQGGRPRQVWRWGQRYVCDFPPAITQLNVFDLLETGTFWITHLVLAGNVWQELIQGSLITPPKTCGCIRPVHEPFEPASQMSPFLLTSHPTWLWSVGSSALVLLVYCHESSDPSLCQPWTAAAALFGRKLSPLALCACISLPRYIIRPPCLRHLLKATSAESPAYDAVDSKEVVNSCGR